MLFGEVIGQETLKQKLVADVRNQHVPHALLFLGQAGYGTLPLALAFSQYLFCENQGDTDSCGQCASCNKTRKLIHPDVHFSFPFPRIDKRERCDEFITDWREAVLSNPYLDLPGWMARFDAENKQPNITIRECHDILRKLSLRAFESSYKVVIIWLAEYLGREGNALLKMIEEPSEGTVFILIAENAELLLPTIVSRTQILKIPPLDAQALARALQQCHEVDAEEAHRLAHQAHGNYNDALHFLQRLSGETQQLFIQWMKLCLPGSYPGKSLDVVNWIERLAATGRENQKNFFKHFMHFLHEVLLMQATGTPAPVWNAEEAALAGQLLQIADHQTIADLYAMANQAHFHAERNAHSKILLMSLSLRVARRLKQNKVTLA
ncbi:MAG: DNA polymerase III subunit delta [Chitinophagales bacterium]|nr:MAG: DNA polymerase III subunit delta [Chitinophagales bacterium]